MFSSTRLYTFVCLALGITITAAPAGAPGSSLAARSPDVYDTTGGIGALLLGLGDNGYRGDDSDEDAYILKRQLAGLIGPGVETTVDANLPNINLPVKRDLYDLTGGIGALLFGGESEGGEDPESDEYILKRQLAQIAGLNIGGGLLTNLGIQRAVRPGAAVPTDTSIPKRDLYDLTGGLGALLFGIEGGETGEGSDEYILKRQLARIAGLNIGGGLGVAPDASILKRDLYDLTGGIGALLFGGDIDSEGGEDSDEYILKRQLAALAGLGNLGIHEVIHPGAAVGADASVLRRDLYDLTGGIGALLFGGDVEGAEDSDEYILKRQLDLGSRLGSNMGLQHAVALAAGAGLTADTAPVNSIPKRDLYDLTGGVGALLFGTEGYGREGDEDTYIL